MDEIVQDEQDRSYYRAIDKKGDEYGVSEQPASTDANVEIKLGLVAKTGGLEVHEIMVEEKEVFGVGCEMFAIDVNGDKKRPE